jgi:hypothetical protein
MVCLHLKFMKNPNKIFIPLLLLITACQSPNLDDNLNTIVVAYVQDSLPGKTNENIDVLQLAFNQMIERENFNLRLIQKVYSSETELEKAILEDSSIDIALLPDYLIQKYQQRWLPPPRESNVLSYMPEFTETYSPYIQDVFNNFFRTEEFAPRNGVKYLEKFIPFSYAHIGVAYNQEEIPFRIRRLKDLLSYIPLSNISLDKDIRMVSYLSSAITYMPEIDQAFQLLNTEAINLFQYQSLLSAYLNTSDINTAEFLSSFNSHPWFTGFENMNVVQAYIGRSDKIGRDLIKEGQPYRFEYLLDASMMLFDGFVFLNDIDLEAYSYFIDELFQPNMVNHIIRQTNKSIVTKSPSILNLLSEYQKPEGSLQSDLTYLFDLSISQTENVIFSYDFDSPLATIFPSKQVHEMSFLKYDFIREGFIESYKRKIDPNYQLVLSTHFNAIFLALLIVPLPLSSSILLIIYHHKKTTSNNRDIKAYKVIKNLKKAQRNKQ